MNSIPNGDILTGIGVGLAVEFIKKILSWFKKKAKRVFYPSDQKKAKEVIERLDSPELEKNPITVELRGNYNIVNIGGNYGFVPKKDSEDDIVKVLNKSKKGETEQKINIIPVEKAEEFINYQNTPKRMEKEFLDIVNMLDSKYKSLVSLSIFIDECYSSDLKEKVEDLKKTIKNRYGDVGLRFTNLWSRGYLKNLFRFLSQKLLQGAILPLDINSRFSEFIERSESIFFIHSSSEANKIASEINGMLEIGKDYVAVHSLGINAYKAREIIKKVNLPENSGYTVVVIDKEVVIKGKKLNDVSKIWYKDNGINTYLLIKDIFL